MRKRQGRRAGTSGQEWSFLLQGHQKARLSAVLAVIVTAVNIMPAAAMSVGKPSLKKKKIEVTFQAGSGGYFEDESGSLSTGADARKASNSDIQRTKWVQSFSELEEDDEGVFTNLRLAAKEAEEDGQEAVWENIVHKANKNEDKDDDLVFAGWYYSGSEGQILVSDWKEIYGDVTLTAQWYSPDQIEGKLAEDYKLTAIGLEERKLSVEPVKKERDAEELAEWAEEELEEEKLEIKGDKTFALGLKLGGKETARRGDKVTVSLDVPKDGPNASDTVTAIHETREGKKKLLLTDVVKAGNGRFRLTFTADGDGDYYFVNTQAVLKPQVTVTAPKNNLAGERAAEDSGSFIQNNGKMLYWEFKDGILTMRIAGDMTDHLAIRPWEKYVSEIKKVIFADGVTNIGNGICKDFKNLTEVEISSTVTRIGRRAFENCVSLVSVEIPKSVRSIDMDAFSGCTNLKTVKFAGTVPSIEPDAFDDCPSLTSDFNMAEGTCGTSLTWKLNSQGELTIKGTGAMKDWERYAAPWNNYSSKVKSAVIENGVTSVGNYAFYSCGNLVSVKLPESLTRIGEFAFYNCEVLSDIVIPKKVAEIGENAFYGCKKLPEGFVLGQGSIEGGVNWKMVSDGTLTIGGSGRMPNWSSKNDVPWNSFFKGSTSIKKAVIQEGVENIGSKAFYGCSDLADVEIAESVAEIGDSAFGVAEHLTAVKIPEKVTAIGSNAFSSCKELTSVNIPGGIERISADIFKDCTKLAQVKIAEGVKHIEPHAFSGTVIKSVLIPESVNFLAQKAFPDDTVITFAKKTEGSEKTLPAGKSKYVQTTNEHKQNIDSYMAKVVNSYLYEGDNGEVYRVEYTSSEVVIEQYNSDFDFVKSWKVSPELPIFGGFYAGEDAFYLVFGKGNGSEDDEQEVLRVVKYSKDMRRLDSVSAYGENTVTPFRAGSLRMDENETYLYIRTSHLMYRSSDGKNHQANMTFALHKEGMVLSYANSMVSNNSTGYVSHSFNQFIQADGKKMVAVDLGDGAPRAVTLMVYPEANYMIEGPETVKLFNITGGFGENYTGVSIGGLEVSGSSYLTAFNSIDQKKFSDSKTRNIFLAVADKDKPSNARCIQVSDYLESGTYSASTPHLVKVSEDLFAVMWEERSKTSSASSLWNPTGEVKIAFFDGNGNSAGSKKIDSFSGSLSDCKPVVINNKVTWYVTDGSRLTFYSFPASLPSSGINVSEEVLKGGSSSGSSSSSGSGSSGGSSGGSGGGGGGGGGGGSRVSSSSSGGPGGPGSSAGSGSTPILTGTWLHDGLGWWFSKTDGSYPKSQWASINGATYYFNDFGYMAEGWLFWNGRWYYLLPGSGAMLTGWINVNGVWYYLNGDGSMATGWINLGGVWYYLRSDGSMAVGWVMDKGKWYFLGFDGAMLANTITPDFHWVGLDGAMIQ